MSMLRKGFTLVEILIVVVILGILAAIVVPQFASASQDAIKSALKSQMQTVSAQIELYRVQNAGTLPDDALIPAAAGGPVGGGLHNGWGVLVGSAFLKDEPRNGFTNTSDVIVEAAIVGAVVGMTTTNGAAAADVEGWVYNSTLGGVYANGYDAELNVLSNETAVAIAPVW